MLSFNPKGSPQTERKMAMDIVKDVIMMMDFSMILCDNCAVGGDCFY